MDIDERLVLLLSGCLWVREPEAATRWVPALAAQAPALVALPGPDGAPTAALPVRTFGALLSPTLTVVREALAAHAQGRSAGLEGQSGQAAAADPLVSTLLDQLSQVARPGLRADLVPALSVAALSRQLIRGLDPAARLPWVPAERRAEAAAVADALRPLDPAARGAATRAVAWALSSRIAAAVGLLGHAGAPVEGGGLLRTMLPNPLILCVDREQLSGAEGLGAACAALGLQVSPALLAELGPAAGAALAQARAAVAAGGGSGAEQAVVALLGEAGGPAQPLLHPEGGPALISLLHDILGEKGLKAAGAGKQTIKALTEPGARGALAAAWRTLGRALGEWDVISALIDRLLPIEVEAAQTTSPWGALPADARWPLLVPRPDAKSAPAAVLAVRLSELRASLAQALGPRAWAAWGLDRALEAHCRKVGATVREWRGDHLICAWPTPELALRQALALREALKPGAPLAVGPEEAELRLPEGSAVGIGLALGVVDGGTDGEHSALGGEAVATALALAGSGKVGKLLADPTLERRAGHGASGLESEGIACSGSFLRVTLDRARKRGEAAHTRGEGGAVHGTDREFAALPVLAYWAQGAEHALVAVAFSESAGRSAAAELRLLTAGQLTELARADQRLGRAAPAPAASRRDVDIFAEDSGPVPPREGRAAPRPSAEPISDRQAAQPRPAPPPRAAAAPSAALPPTPTPPRPAPAPRPSPQAEAAPVPPPPGPSPLLWAGEDDEPATAPPSTPPAAPAKVAPAAAPFAADPFAGDPFAADEEETGSGLAPSVSVFGFPPAPTPARAAARPAPAATPPAPAPTPAPAPAPDPLLDDPFADDEPDQGPALHEQPKGAAGRPAPAPSAPMLLDDDLGALGPPLSSAPAPAPSAPRAAAPSPWAAAGDDDDPFAGLELGPSPAARDPFGGDSGVSFPPPPSSAAPPPIASTPAVPSAPMMLDDDPFAAMAAPTPARAPAPPSAPPAPRSPAPPAAPTPERAPRSLAPHLAGHFQQYVYIEAGSGWTFGLRDGGVLRDALRFDGESVDEALSHFLQQKITERLTPQTERTLPLLTGSAPKPLTAPMVQRACARVGL
ncbi:MAG: hypothetical protein JNM72_19830 [Deltaproteobacteria bacterium]|nr:hypothetical protein [Deltaproteobacteria bacterium]